MIINKRKKEIYAWLGFYDNNKKFVVKVGRSSNSVKERQNDYAKLHGITFNDIPEEFDCSYLDITTLESACHQALMNQGFTRVRCSDDSNSKETFQHNNYTTPDSLFDFAKKIIDSTVSRFKDDALKYHLSDSKFKQLSESYDLADLDRKIEVWEKFLSLHFTRRKYCQHVSCSTIKISYEAPTGQELGYHIEPSMVHFPGFVIRVGNIQSDGSVDFFVKDSASIDAGSLVEEPSLRALKKLNIHFGIKESRQAYQEQLDQHMKCVKQLVGQLLNLLSQCLSISVKRINGQSHSLIIPNRFLLQDFRIGIWIEETHVVRVTEFDYVFFSKESFDSFINTNPYIENRVFYYVDVNTNVLEKQMLVFYKLWCEAQFSCLVKFNGVDGSEEHDYILKKLIQSYTNCNFDMIRRLIDLTNYTFS